MNFLAHLYLSPENKDVMLGNFIADAIKGKSLLNYKPEIQKGVALHRAIDTYTDEHPVFKQSADRLRRKYKLYSKVIVDIYYDHFLARKWNNYSDTELTRFASSAYKTLIMNYGILPSRYKRILPFMIAQNWLVGYASFWSLEKVFRGMARRTGFKSGMENAVTDLKKDYRAFESEFVEFFPRLENFVSELNYTDSEQDCDN